MPVHATSTTVSVTDRSVGTSSATRILATTSALPGGMAATRTSGAISSASTATDVSDTTSTGSDATASAKAVALAYLQALQAKRWTTMWQLSHPLAQARWPSQAAFAAFLATKFAPGGASTIKAVSVTKPTVLNAWDDVRFTTQPLTAVQVTGTLTLNADAPYAVPPSDLTDSAPLVLAKNSTTGHWEVVNGGPADVQGPVLTPSHPAARTLRVPIMMYHHIAPEPQRTRQMTDYDYRLAVDLTVTPAGFAAQLDWLLTHGYQTVTLQQLMAALYDGVALPPRPIILTFDDGYLDNAQYAAPALLQRHMVGVFNVITGLVGTNGALHYMTWKQISALAAEGMVIESHTVFHEDLGILSDLQAQTELVDSRKMLTDHLGFPPQFICYPSGEPFRSGTVAAQRRISQFVTQDGYVGGLLDPPVAGMMQSSVTPNQLTRVRVAGQEPLSGFIASIGG